MSLKINDTMIVSDDTSVRLADMTAVSKKKTLYGWLVDAIMMAFTLLVLSGAFVRGLGWGVFTEALYLWIGYVVLSFIYPTHKLVVLAGGKNHSFLSNQIKIESLYKQAASYLSNQDST